MINDGAEGRALPGAEDASSLSGRLGYLVEQLWRPVLEDPAVRAVAGRTRPADSPEWSVAESYLVLPSLKRATLLIPDGPRAATVGALLNFRGLRRRLPNLQRTALGSLARAGLSPFPHVSLLTRPGAQHPALPLASVAQALGRDRVWAAIGVNLSANRKTTLQLVSSDGAPAGFAKFSWEPVSVEAVRTEAAALRAVGGNPGPARAPELLAEADYHGYPFIVSAPLPAESVGVRSGVAPPSAKELYSILPLSRRARVAETEQFAAVRTRLSAVPTDSENREVLAATAALLELLGGRDVEVPVQSRWHGDLAAWNTARSVDGTLWLWDWESSELDTAAGLDPLHWFMSEGMEAGRAWDGSSLLAAVEAATPLMTAAGTPKHGRPDVTAVYAATIAERACTLAAGAGGWGADWVMPRELLDLVQTARRLVESSVGIG